ncbi:MAG: hypothetical protein Q7S48_02190 [bacterium]|nr:hypothetical protein [bacterium]
MGYSLSWIAVQGHPTDEIKEFFGLKTTGTYGRYGKHALVGRALSDGWYLLIANTCDDKIIRDEILESLSKDCQIVACSIEEHVMFSASALWKKGKKIWSVTHNGEEDSFDIAEHGNIPASYSALKNQAIAEQKAEGDTDMMVDHLFDLPLLLAKQLVGFKHDEPSPKIPQDSYEVFEDGNRSGFLHALSTSPWLWRIIGPVIFFGFWSLVAMFIIFVFLKIF